MPSPAVIFRLACLACLPLATVARSISPWVLPRDANTTSCAAESTTTTPSSPYIMTCDAGDDDSKYGKVHGLLDGYHYLMNRDGQPGNDPNSCGRISCSYDTAIQWCNKDLDNRKDLDSYQVIARAALEILGTKACWHHPEEDNYLEAAIYGEAEVVGENWSVKVYQDVC
ncbi:hypothetical protein B0T20DRAFT_469406 [Sordaria brevicollis]|uniref:Uncharacterized protein n=1 Tax=Sordaria brevicollis TaxID=83679 RepID=A0AAE0UBV4_SORBR|nr:hypothetical protein B0T20DRAFT_469406 [Sordaria brevicollis]